MEDGNASASTTEQSLVVAKKTRKKRSEVWNHFHIVRDENGLEWAQCNICDM